MGNPSDEDKADERNRGAIFMQGGQGAFAATEGVDLALRRSPHQDVTNERAGRASSTISSPCRGGPVRSHLTVPCRILSHGAPRRSTAVIPVGAAIPRPEGSGASHSRQPGRRAAAHCSRPGEAEGARDTSAHPAAPVQPVLLGTFLHRFLHGPDRRDPAGDGLPLVGRACDPGILPWPRGGNCGPASVPVSGDQIS